MTKYFIRSFLSAIPTIFGVLTFVFLITRIIPGDPALLILGEEATNQEIAELRSQLGLDKPIYIQYIDYLNQLIHGDFGISLRTERSVISEIFGIVRYSMELAFGGILVSIIIGIPIGILSAIRRKTLFDYGSMTFALFGISLPVFWTGMIFILIFSLYLGWLPSIGIGDSTNFISRIIHLILPSTVIGMATGAITARMTRASMIDVLHQDYIDTAMSKGLSEFKVVVKHAFRNALIPVITVIGLNMGRLLGGTIVTEMVFARPGMGKLLVDAIYARDYPQIQGVVIFYAILIMIVNLIVDLLYSATDPRITLS